jgi:hypothetical protein
LKMDNQKTTHPYIEVQVATCPYKRQLFNSFEKTKPCVLENGESENHESLY